MPMLIAHDEQLLTRVSLEMATAIGQSGDLRQMINDQGRVYSARGDNKIFFQFPPIIKSDNKGSDWKEFAKALPEPIAIFTGGKPRTVSLKWTYIVNGMHSNGKQWVIDSVADQVKRVRSYFYNMVGNACIVNLSFYDVLGSAKSPNTWTFRATDLSVDHSDTLVSIGQQVYPLRTDLGLTLMMYVDPVMAGPVGAKQPLYSNSGQQISGAAARSGIDMSNYDNSVYSIEKLAGIPDQIEWF